MSVVPPASVAPLAPPPRWLLPLVIVVLILLALAFWGIVWGIVRGHDQGWTSPEILASLAAGLLLLVLFVAWEARAASPMLPLRLFRSRAFSAANGVSLLMSFGIFGSIFLLAQFLQTGQGYSAFDAGVRTLPWTLMPMFVAPVAGVLSSRIGGRPLLVAGLALQAIAMAWLALITTPTVPYSSLIVPFALAGVGMALVFAPVANIVLSSVAEDEQGKASGVNSTMREIGGALGVAVLASVFTANGSLATPQSYADGLIPAVWVGAGVLAIGSLLALAVPGKQRQARESSSLDPALAVE